MHTTIIGVAILDTSDVERLFATLKSLHYHFMPRVGQQGGNCLDVEFLVIPFAHRHYITNYDDA